MTRLAAILLSAALLAAGCGGGAKPAASHRGPPQLTGIHQLQAAFDAHPGVPRLLILLSPT